MLGHRLTAANVEERRRTTLKVDVSRGWLSGPAPLSSPTPIPSTMHRALLVDEILCVIFESLADSGHRRSTLSAALTTKTFMESALAALWREIQDLKVIHSLWPHKVPLSCIAEYPYVVSNHPRLETG